MTYHLTLFALIIVSFWGLFLWWTARPTPPRQESRYEILEETRQIVEFTRILDAIDNGVIRLDEGQALKEMNERHEAEKEAGREFTTEELKRIMRKRDPFRRNK